ncbi:ankyrin repeat-containing domain protein [Xylaria sp. FL0043]|nr:ankyrin repeat-containing domain protein [Xylaria sp. FL0043]
MMSSDAGINNHSSGPQNIAAGCGPQSNMNGPGTQYNYYGSLQDPRKAEEERLRQEKEDCFRSLSYPDMNSRRATINDAHPSTCEWFFYTTEFKEWRHRYHLSSHNGVLWVKGKPGAGKSTLMSHTLTHCEEVFADHLIVSFFFNARGSILEKTPLGMLRSLTCQLIDKDNTMYNSFVHSYREKLKYNGPGFHWKEQELRRFIQRSVAELPKSKPLLLLVDALDECDEKEVRDVVGFLETLSLDANTRGIQLRICLSSRHYPWISMKKKLELIVETREGHGTDIATYVSDKLLKEDDSIEEQIRQKAGGIFLWVVLVVAMLNKAYDDGREEAMQKILDEIPEDLEGLFDRLVPKGDSDKAEFVWMVQWVLFSKRRLGPEELYIATVNKLLPSRETIRRRILSSSKGLIEVKGQPGTEFVQFIHLSVNDFLYRNKRLETLDPSLQPDFISASHARLWADCWSHIKWLNTTLPSPGSPVREIKPSRDEYDGCLQYAAAHILDHANEALSNQTISRRLDCDITEWLAAKDGWLGCVEEAAVVAGKHNRQLLGTSGGDFRLMLSLAAALSQNLIRAAVAEGADINALDDQYGTALQAASKYMGFEAVQLLLDAGADVTVRGGEMGNALQAASHAGDIRIVELLLRRGANINAQGGRFGNALQAAADHLDEQYEVVQLLLCAGADVNARGGYYGTALQAAAYGGHYKIVRRLVERGADIHTQGGYYGNALQGAVCSGSDIIVGFLLDAGADVNAQGGCYGTALQAAAYERHYEMVRQLVEKGADVNARGGYYGNALQGAVCSGSNIIVGFLLDAGANVNAQGGYYNTALQAATYEGHYEMVQWLLKSGADVNA